ncbi:phosphatase PAP2 family protein [Mycobacterium spongiae]|uniref:Phosphatase PAP2 family protein n=1 Tax=Mycobacterium spongiae TaxID=886343 RepID=A0A975PV92_9MYCO|nr:phosphatase PAP2 family protein [Mycobacterium spongiae]QUR65772.1 phosphatase PAP2 family protein [Mycobacterium spongiae]
MDGVGGASALGSARFGLIGIGVVALLVALMVVSVWVVRHPLRGRRVACIDDLLDLLPARPDAPTSRLRVGLGTRGVALALGLAGLAVVVVLAVGFTALLDSVLEGEGLAEFDDPAAHWLAGHRELWLTQVLLVVTRMGNSDAQAAWIVLVCVVAAVRARSCFPVLVGMAGGGGIWLVIVIAKVLVGRQRPALPYAVISVHGFSFPSGHATGAAAVGMLCAWMLCRWVVRRWALQVLVWAVTIAMIALIGFSRPYLGVHFITDVLAGWLLGAAWAAAVIVLASSWLRVQPSETSGQLQGPEGVG